MNAPARILAILLTLLLGTTAAAQSTTTVDIRTGVTLRTGEPVLLKDIATVAGPDADRLASIVVLHADQAKATTTEATHAVSREDVRSALDNAAANWARTLVRGSGVTISFTSPVAKAEPTATTPPPAPSVATAPSTSQAQPSKQPSTPTPPQASKSANTLRNMIHRALADYAGTSTDAVTMRIDVLPAADQQQLLAPLSPAWRLRVEVVGASPTGRTSVRVEAYESDRLALGKTYTIEALVQRDVIVAGPGGLTREQVISANDLRLDTRTMPVSESARLSAVTAEQLVGNTTKRRIDQGKPVLLADVSSPKAAIIVNRGDDVWVSCLAGGIMLKTKATALASARDGEMVSLLIENTRTNDKGVVTKTKKTVSARMNGPGKAVMSVESLNFTENENPTPAPRRASSH